MKTVLLGPVPAELETLLERRRASGLDRFDEVWEGDYHMVPAPSGAHAYVDKRLGFILEPLAESAGLHGLTTFNLGEPGDFRVPDGGYVRGPVEGVWFSTAAVVVEVVSPDDETYEKFGFYAAHRVDELVIADPATATIRMFELRDGGYTETRASAILGITTSALTEAIDWP